MRSQKTVFSQVVDFLPTDHFAICVRRYGGQKSVQSFTCWDQFLCLLFGQLTYRESLRDIETCLRSRQSKLYHMGFRGRISRSSLADANERRDWHIFADFAQTVIQQTIHLYADHHLEGLDMEATIYAFDSTTIKLCLSLFPWAHFRKTQEKGAVKMHTLLNLRGNIPAFILITTGSVHDVNALDDLPIEAGAFYILDRGYIDFKRLFRFAQAKALFVVRGRKNLKFKRLYSQKVDKTTGIKSDQVGLLTGTTSAKNYPIKIRRIRFIDPETQKQFLFFTNQLQLPAQTIVLLYKYRWRVELFFKWVKQHLRIKAFYGTSENAVNIQIWVAIIVYLVVAKVKKTLEIDHSLYRILQILSVTPFEEVELYQLLTNRDHKTQKIPVCNQLSLFDLKTGH